MDFSLHICSNKKNGFRHIASRITWPLIQIRSDCVLQQMLRSPRAISMEIKWLICERPKKLLIGMVRALIPMKQLSQVLNFNANTDINRGMEK